MSRPTWVGSLSFGLVHVPVRLHPAVRSRRVRFHQLHDADGGRLQLRRVCSLDGEEVPYEHVVKGYELAPGHTVEVTLPELESFDLESSYTLELAEFIDPAEVDPVFLAEAYHLVPDRGAERPYALVVAALRQSGKAGLGRLVMHHQGHLCLVRPFGRGLSLSTLHYADELVPQDSLEELELAGALPQAQEVEMALRLVYSRAASFEPRRYHDAHRERLLAFLEKRGRAQARLPAAELPPPPPRPPQRAVPHAPERAVAPPSPEREELLATLEESIAALSRAAGRGPRAEARALPPQEGALRVRQEAARTTRSPRGTRGRKG
ncbi:Ku protein [Myxococcaceae bacterium GXIMD 01537]